VKLDRRTVLKGLLGGVAVSIALPPLEAMWNGGGTALADGSAFPKRFGLWTWANGILPDFWTPSSSGSGDAWALSDLLAPLAPHKSKIAVVTGTQVHAVNSIPHYSGFGAVLTGLAQLGEEDDQTFAGPTIDQQIAAQLGGLTAYRSIETGGWFDLPISHNGPHSPNPPERSPHALFTRLFGPTFRAPGEEGGVVDPKLALRQSVLDVVTDRIAALQTKLGAADRARLDQHLSGIRDLETRLARLQAGPPDLAACVRPTEPDAGGDDDGLLADAFLNHRALADLIALALACDQTRVVTMSFMTPVSNYLFPGATMGHHELTHNEPGDQPQVHANTLRAIGELDYFLGALDAIEEGDGTLLDHSLVLGTTDVSLGKTHSLDEWPFVIGGSADGALLQDVHVRSDGRENASKVMLTILRAMGIPAASYGDEDRATTDGLSGIEA
jgi:hypothetical protein